MSNFSFHFLFSQKDQFCDPESNEFSANHLCLRDHQRCPVPKMCVQKESALKQRAQWFSGIVQNWFKAELAVTSFACYESVLNSTDFLWDFNSGTVKILWKLLQSLSTYIKLVSHDCHTAGCWKRLIWLIFDSMEWKIKFADKFMLLRQQVISDVHFGWRTGEKKQKCMSFSKSERGTIGTMLWRTKPLTLLF